MMSSIEDYLMSERILECNHSNRCNCNCHGEIRFNDLSSYDFGNDKSKRNINAFIVVPDDDENTSIFLIKKEFTMIKNDFGKKFEVVRCNECGVLFLNDKKENCKNVIDIMNASCIYAVKCVFLRDYRATLEGS